jgi:hypothetical protein
MTVQEQDAYHDGAQAFRQDRPNEDNPHASGRSAGEGFSQLRYYWFQGWYDAKHAHLM